MGTTQSSRPWLACHSDGNTNQLEKEPCTDSTFTPSTTDTQSISSRKRSTRNNNNNDHPIRHKALHFICSCPCNTIHDQTNASISSWTADASFISSNFKTPHNGLCFSSNAGDQEDMNSNDDESPNNSLFYQRCIDSHQNGTNAETQSLQMQQHCPNIDGLDLDRVHPSRGPYLGTMSWEPSSPMDCSKSLLDLSHHDPHDDDSEGEEEEEDKEAGGEEDCNGGMEEGFGGHKTELVEPPMSSPWKGFSPIPSSPSSSSPLTHTVVEAKNDSDMVGICSPTESGNEIEISFIPPKRLFQDSFVDSNSNNNNHNHCNHHDSMDRSANKDTFPTPSQSTIVLSTSNDNETMTPSQDDKFHDELAQDHPLASSQCHNATTTSSITIQSSEPDGYPLDGAYKWGMIHINTLPSFQHGRPIRLKMKESYRGYETRVVMKKGNMKKNEDNDKDDGDNDNDDDDGNHDVILDLSNLSLLSDATQQEHFFSYDPYFSLGQYVITTVGGGQYGNGLCVEMGERYMTLQDQNERVWGVIRSRHTWIPSAVIYSPKQRFCGQVASSHRPLENKRRSDGGNGDVKLYPWALVKKHGRRMDHNVTIHMVAEPNATTTGGSFELLGGLFEKKPMFRSRHGFDTMGNHQNTVVYRVANNTDCGMEKEYPCCKSVRDTVQKDLFHVTIAPGIDPLLIICYMAAHSKMDVEPKLCGDL